MQARWQQRPQIAWPVWFAAEAVATYVTWAWLRPVQLPPIGFPGGLAVAAALLSGPWTAVPVALGALAGAVAVGASFTQSIFVTGVIFEALLVWAIYHRVFREKPVLVNLHDALRFFFAAAFGALFSAVAGAWMLTRIIGGHVDPSDYVTGGTYLWTSQLIGMLLVVPPFLSCAMREEHVRWGRNALGTAAAIAVVLAFGLLMFYRTHATGADVRFLPLVVMPLIVWIALRGPAPLALATPAAFMLIAISGTTLHRGALGTKLLGGSLTMLEALGAALGATCLAIVATDSGRREALREITAREAQLRRVFEGSHDGFWDWDVASGSLHASGRVAEILGHEPQRWPEDFEALVAPEQRDATRRCDAQHLGADSEPYRRDYRVLDGNGEWRYLLERGRVTERDANGRPLRVSGTLTDVTARRRAELESQASRELFEQLVRHLPGLVGIRSDDGRMLYMNPAMQRLVWGALRPDYEGRPLEELFTPEIAAQFRETDGSMDEQGGAIVVPQTMPTPSGPVHVMTAKFRLHDAAGRRLVCAVSIDVSEQHRVEEERRLLEARMTEAQKFESLGLLAGGVAHDFNNILTSILGYADLAREQLPPGSAVRGDLDQIVAGARRAGELTRQMLAYAGRSGGELTPLAPAALIEEIGHLLQVSTPKRVTLRHEFAPDLPAIDGDATQLRQVVMNLILNAAEAIGERPGTIVVRLQVREFEREELVSRWTADQLAPGRYLALEVLDDGCGMEPGTLARMFDPFYTTKFAGRGLGLAAVLGIVRTHHGIVHVESEPSAGTTFRVVLPISAHSLAAPSTPEPNGHWHAHGTALVVDDEPAVRGLALAMLRRLGFDQVLTAAGGQEAVDLLERTGTIDLVLLDVAMPGMDGETAFAAMRERRPGLRVLVSSGYAEPAWRAEHLAAIAGFVAKPYRVEDLESAVRAALEPAAS